MSRKVKTPPGSTKGLREVLKAKLTVEQYEEINKKFHDTLGIGISTKFNWWNDSSKIPAAKLKEIVELLKPFGITYEDII